MSRKKLSVFQYLPFSRSPIAPIALRYKFDTFLPLLFAIRETDMTEKTNPPDALSYIGDLVNSPDPLSPMQKNLVYDNCRMFSLCY